MVVESKRKEKGVDCLTIKGLTGKRFGRLTVIKPCYPRGRDIMYACKCDCGEEKIIAGRNLCSGNTKSCGCLKRELDKQRKVYRRGEVRLFGKDNPNYKHGSSHTRLYHIWGGMKQRCTNPKATEFSAYGGRGITVCNEWLHDFAAFQEWALSHGYRDDLTIDRIDNDKGYRPDNCRWATKEQQYSNTQRAYRSNK